jgi:hypothetical protein
MPIPSCAKMGADCWLKRQITCSNTRRSLLAGDNAYQTARSPITRHDATHHSVRLGIVGLSA